MDKTYTAALAAKLLWSLLGVAFLVNELFIITVA